MPELHMWHVPEHAKLIYGHGNQNTGLLWGRRLTKDTSGCGDSGEMIFSIIKELVEWGKHLSKFINCPLMICVFHCI